MLTLSVNVSGEWLKDGEATQKNIPVDLVERSLADRQWIQVYADTEYFLKINLKSPGKNKKVRSKDMIPFAKYIVMRCAIWYHLVPLRIKKREKHPWSKKVKVTLLHGCFSRFLNSATHRICRVLNISHSIDSRLHLLRNYFPVII